MEIRSNVLSPNFGMALRINKGARKGLEECATDVIQNLETACYKIKDTKFYHVEVGDDLSAKLVADKNAYFGLFSEKDSTALRYGEAIVDGCYRTDNRIIILNNDCGRFAVGRFLPYGDDTKPFFKVWSNYGECDRVNYINSLASVARSLDLAAVTKYNEQLAAKNNVNPAVKVDVSKRVGKLLDKYGV